MATIQNFIIYNASAGSGKTYTLAVQYIARMLASCRETERAYRQVLAVTFTNKATAEMKDRILQQLYGISRSLPESDSYLASVAEALAEMGHTCDKSVIRVEAGRLLGDILHDYSHFRVETIDMFFRSVFVDMARELGLPNGLKADIDNNRAIGEAVDRIIARLNTDDRLRRWVGEFVKESMDDGKRWNVAYELKSFANHIFKAEYINHQESLAEFLSDDEKVQHLRKTLDDRQEEMKAAVADFLCQIEDLLSDSAAPGLKNIRNLHSFIRHVREYFIEGKAKAAEQTFPGKQITGMANDPNDLLKAKFKPEEATLAMSVSPMLCDLLKVVETARETINTITITRRHLNPMRLLATIATEVNRVVQDSGAFLLSNINILLDRMVADDDASFIYEKTGSVLRHIMLDEFQDTSLLQWRNFQTLIKDNMAKGGSTLVVGDVKQSIYRWREGDSSILANLHLAMARYAPISKSLRTNFRSTQPIINFNNALYLNISEFVNNLEANPSEWDIRQIYNRTDVCQECPKGCLAEGTVQVVVQTSTKSSEVHVAAVDEMCHTICSLIHAGHQPDKMVILIRKKDELPLIAKTFAEVMPDIPLVSDDVFFLSNSPAVNILINALRVILHPTDHASLGRLVFLYNKEVRGCGTDVNALFDHTDRKQPFKSIARHLPPAFSNLDNLRRLPLFELLMEVSTMFNLSEIKGQSAYLMAFYDCITGNTDDSALSLTGLLKYWDEKLCTKSIPGGDVKGVHVMTIHRSKGLQWQSVFIPCCDWPIHDTLSNTIWCPADDIPMLCGLPMTAVDTTSSVEHSAFAPYYTSERRSQRLDNLNLLYVATTRAEANLYIWGATPKEPKKNFPMIALIGETFAKLPQGTITSTDNEKRYICGQPAINIKKGAKEKSANRLDINYTTPPFTSRIYPALLDFKQSNDAKRFTGKSEHEEPTPTQTRYINTGSILHAIFASVTTHIPGKRNGVVPGRVLQTDAPIPYSMYKKAAALLDNGCRNRQVADWFSGRFMVNNECSIISRDPDTGRLVEHRPDRVMMSDSEIIVVDFKFGKPKPAYEEQVQTYMSLLKDMYPLKAVKGFLWYVYQNEIKLLTHDGYR